MPLSLFTKKILLLSLIVSFMCGYSKSQSIQHVNHLFYQQGDQYMLIRVDVKNWDHTWNFDGKPNADVSVWLYNKTRRKYKVNNLVVALHCGGKNGIISVNFTPHFQVPVGENIRYNEYAKIKYAGTWEENVISAAPFKGFLVEAINIIEQDITLVQEDKPTTSKNPPIKSITGNIPTNSTISKYNPTPVKRANPMASGATGQENESDKTPAAASRPEPQAVLTETPGWNAQDIRYDRVYNGYTNYFIFKWDLAISNKIVDLEHTYSRRPEGEY